METEQKPTGKTTMRLRVQWKKPNTKLHHFPERLRTSWSLISTKTWSYVVEVQRIDINTRDKLATKIYRTFGAGHFNVCFCSACANKFGCAYRKFAEIIIYPKLIDEFGLNSFRILDISKYESLDKAEKKFSEQSFIFVPASDITQRFLDYRKPNISRRRQIIKIEQDKDNIVLELSFYKDVYYITKFEKRNFKQYTSTDYCTYDWIMFSEESKFGERVDRMYKFGSWWLDN